MPASAYLQSAIFLVLAAVALFASAGTLAIAGFWIYLAIFSAIVVASLLWLDPGWSASACGRAVRSRQLRCNCSRVC
jgi:hypothetical protein